MGLDALTCQKPLQHDFSLRGNSMIGQSNQQEHTLLVQCRQANILRVIDVVLAALLILLGLPVWGCIALAIRINSPGAVIYKQTRIGMNGKLFTVYKFRSMHNNADRLQEALQAHNQAQGPIFKIKDDPRITPVGKLLRRTSFDEIPQLINVLRGEMSLVGPRPHPVSDVAKYEEWHKARLAIKPGLTGLWQISGRSDISFNEGILMDLYYIENQSLRLYFKILLYTIPAVLSCRGAY
jgi:lipopolysaccharide/colanic/teichoic acid biosynthesis glycosyltransferase